MPAPLINDPEDALLVCNALPGLGPVSLRRLLEAFGDDPCRLPGAPVAELAAVGGVSRKVAEALANWPEHFSLEREREQLDRRDASFLSFRNPRYPQALLDLHDPPIGLYCAGPLDLNRRSVAIVGSRRCTVYGRRVAHRLAADLARQGVTIVSGLAHGIDAAAHEGALEVGGATAAVLGNGIDLVYPAEHVDLYRQIATTGAVLTEFPAGRRADRQTFPMRNRVVAGMVAAVVVVETDERGGSLITARFALDCGRVVGSVPGRIDEPASRGCHRLLRDGAFLVTDAEGLLAELGWTGQTLLPGLAAGEAKTGPDFASATESEKRVLELLAGGERLDADRLAAATGRSIAEAASLLVLLEIRGWVQKDPEGGVSLVR